jgi:Flp pilus assembly protein TadG
MIMRALDQHQLRHQRGLALVEMAIVLPLLLLLILVGAEFGRVLYQYTTLTKALQDGARYIAANARAGSTGTLELSGGDTTIARNLIVCGRPNCGAGGELLPGLAEAAIQFTLLADDHIRVQASYPYRPMLGMTLPTFGFGEPISLAIDLRASTVKRAL